MTDRNPVNPGRVRLDPVVGMPNIYDMTLEDGATVQGTPLNKNTFLKDQTATKLGLTGSDPTVDDALYALSESGVGRSLYGETVYPTAGTSAIGQFGSEIFNDYRTRTQADQSRGNVAVGLYSHAEGNDTTAIGNQSHSEGSSTTANGESSHSEGDTTTASGWCSHAEGYSCTASGSCSHAGGNECTASGGRSFAHGYQARATEDESVAIGYSPMASGFASFSAGAGCMAKGYWSVAVGTFARADSDSTTSIGAYNNQTSSGDALVVGAGYSTANRRNGLRVTATDVYGGSYNSSGADYAEYFEWDDGNPDNEDRVGLFVTLKGKYIRIATSSDDFILGIVSGDPSVVGDAHDDQWHDMYVRDIYGRVVCGDVIVPPVLNSDGNVVIEEHAIHAPLVREDYDASIEYTPRSSRPEWDAVGMLGKLVVEDDGSCKVDAWCKPNDDGVATHSSKKTNFRVMERLDDTHIRVLVI